MTDFGLRRADWNDRSAECKGDGWCGGGFGGAQGGACVGRSYGGESGGLMMEWWSDARGQKPDCQTADVMHGAGSRAGH